MPEAAAAPTAPGAATAPTRRRRKLLPLILVAVAALVVAGLAGIPLLRRATSAGGEKPAQAAHEEPGGLVAVEPMLVNLADRDAQRLAKITIRLVLATEAEAKEVEEDALRKARLRSAILELVAQQAAADLATAEGRAKLRLGLADRAAHVLGLKVHDVLFTDLVVQ